MALYDLLFPLNLGPLTYKGPAGLKPGALVSAELKKTITRAIVLGPSRETGDRKGIKDIAHVHGDLLSPALLKLVTWMADYYFSKEGIVLKEIFPKDIMKKIDGSYFARAAQGAPSLLAPEDDIVKKISENASKEYYKTFLLHAPSTAYQAGLISALVKCQRDILILCPEVADVRHIAEAVGESAGDRLAVLHGELAPRERRKELKKILTGQCDIVIGSRIALFAPLKRISLIAVLNEESLTHKKEEGLAYNVRDMAVMRAYLEGATALLSSICPSFESVYNARSGKYTLIKPDIAPKRPKIRLIDMRTSRRITPYISKPLLDKAVYVMKKGGKAAFLINRKGYSLLECEECEWMGECENCGIPLVLRRADNSLRCGYCGFKRDVPDICPRCGSPKLGMPGAGIERIEADIGSLLGATTLRFEAGGKGKTPEIELIESNVVVGTKLIAKRRELSERFSLIGVINGDSYLGLPDFRAQERTFQEVVHLSERCLPEGEIIIQTRQGRMPIFKALRGFDFERFYEEGIMARRELFYPPFSKMALVTGMGRPPELSIRRLPEGVELLGPASSRTKGRTSWKLLIKAKTRESLRKTVSSVLKAVPEAAVDMDPVSV